MQGFLRLLLRIAGSYLPEFLRSMLLDRRFHLFPGYRTLLRKMVQQPRKTSKWALGFRPDKEIAALVDQENEPISLLQPQTLADLLGNRYPTLGSQGTDGHHILLTPFAADSLHHLQVRELRQQLSLTGFLEEHGEARLIPLSFKLQYDTVA